MQRVKIIYNTNYVENLPDNGYNKWKYRKRIWKQWDCVLDLIETNVTINQRAVFCGIINNMTERQIANYMGISQQSVNKLKRRLIRKLQKRLKLSISY
jgi:DNA-directed RNA polymerase specialized sigma subunit